MKFTCADFTEEIHLGLSAQVDLKTLKLGAFSRAAFVLPSWVQTALAGDVRDLRVTVTLNTAGNAGSFLMDNLRGEP